MTKYKLENGGLYRQEKGALGGMDWMHVARIPSRYTLKEAIEYFEGCDDDERG